MSGVEVYDRWSKRLRPLPRAKLIDLLHRCERRYDCATEAAWPDVAGYFTFKLSVETPLGLANRLAQQWAPRFGQTVPEITSRTPARREVWTHERVGEHLDRMAKLTPKMIVDRPPRLDGGALVLFELPDGTIGQLDGRCRANLWRRRPGLYQVLILELGR